MSREIKFRGKRIDTGEWVYGYYISFSHEKTGGDNSQSEIGHFIFQKNKDESDVYYEVRPETIGQFTGLTDKNGKDIYEGDVLCWPNYEGTKNETRWVMQWNNYRAAWTDYSPKEEAQITGTIHD